MVPETCAAIVGGHLHVHTMYTAQTQTWQTCVQSVIYITVLPGVAAVRLRQRDERDEATTKHWWIAASSCKWSWSDQWISESYHETMSAYTVAELLPLDFILLNTASSQTWKQKEHICHDVGIIILHTHIVRMFASMHRLDGFVRLLQKAFRKSNWSVLLWERLRCLGHRVNARNVTQKKSSGEPGSAKRGADEKSLMKNSDHWSNKKVAGKKVYLVYPVRANDGSKGIFQRTFEDGLRRTTLLKNQDPHTAQQKCQNWKESWRNCPANFSRAQVFMCLWMTGHRPWVPSLHLDYADAGFYFKKKMLNGNHQPPECNTEGCEKICETNARDKWRQK